MKKILLLVLAICVCFSASLPADDIAPEKRQEIEKMLKLTGVEKLTTQMMNQIIDTMKAQSPEVPDEVWNKIKAKADIHDLIERIIPIYDKYYSLDDLKAVNAFYSSPAGQKLLANLPQVTQEAMKAGQEWGEELGRRIDKELEDEKAAKDGGSK